MVASTAPSGGSGLYAEPREDWLKRHTEDILDPGRPIVDPHHHLWDRTGQPQGTTSSQPSMSTAGRCTALTGLRR